MIKQVRFSNSVKFFEKGFCERWNMHPYNDINAPCFFAGVYSQEDVDVINKHKAFKVILNTGKVREIFLNINKKNVIVMEGWINCDFIKFKYPMKHVYIPLKDFSMFKPNTMGKKVYCYLGNKAMQDSMGFGLMEKLKKAIPYEVIYGYQGHPIEFVKKNYYDECFVNIKPNIVGGFTTAQELAHMGRMTISNALAPFCKPYSDIAEICHLINKESKKIGTIQPSCMGKFYNTGDEWKQVKFWQ